MTEKFGGNSSADGSSVYRNFAENLISLATRDGSIAQTCRDLNINRQQFNKYLSGSVLPNAETLARITTHFQIDALALFGPTNVTSAKTKDSSHSESHWQSALNQTIENLKQRDTFNTIIEGVYKYYLPWYPDTSRCVCGIIIFKKIDDLVFFTRVVRIRSHLVVGSAARNIVVDGIVSFDQNRLSLVGRTRYKQRTLTMLNIELNSQTPSGYLMGLMLIHNPQGRPMATRFALKRFGASSDWKKFYRMSGVFDGDHPSLPKEILAMTEMGFNSTTASLFPADLLNQWKIV